MSSGVAQQKTSQGIFASVSGDKVLATPGFCLNKRGRGRARERKTGKKKENGAREQKRERKRREMEAFKFPRRGFDAASAMKGRGRSNRGEAVSK